MSHIIVIPARYQSSRLPGKPLVELCGVPMIVRTYRQCLKAAPGENIYVATDNEEIKATCEAVGIQVILTSSECLTGTDRVAEVSRQIEVDTYINVQGDEPVFNPEDLKALITAAQQHPDDVINGYCTLSDEALFRSSSTPKVVMRPDGRLLYMSRAPIPTNKAHGFDQAWRQVCAYAFPRKALKAFAQTSLKTPLENIEDIEILRFLELGFDVRMIPMTDISVAVDNPEDVKRAELVIHQLGLE
ncbi:3-deoxy-manno-octulosonate cytidylyltransferase [Azotobacter beijerinckii]|uniref:3-deoxy-manno-octulosonate cytidylyltransferase (CMP-KDO synthetase) n=1 Tax=Azotobacter beijerinckii TaxID=170623 RepID=A0A1I3ZUI2_9GAMM|nr:3-deoxy-manno-octulosonate cytidylyltransferase [Azotobacter beijerinckii]SFA85626.1 3-deoxy-manno-octulosonate cytidylyltransferase (CMP-KDO synthetase) [Azotobacter beijerinckii]SFK47560.1 3-deoxy-manno-octulosonate cytidylyltransferase (CMP-KDO synthetase) [Azotobacter beijerinckii]